ncbi:hypothetical protein KP509_18G080500 [Ceratopteris richardii]|uniref:t-SNARE coiled-coil homology domain-containing protein n=1 Tax=Ceratopteris richardii TaxID=49495 RepID=A0A8T2SR69_CERRI|nr:hypothetical protein KP509_18G080500 [Ceratopteris richardii]
MNTLNDPLLSPSAASPSSSVAVSHGQVSYSGSTNLHNDNLSAFFEKVEDITFRTEALRQAFHVLQQEMFKQSPKSSTDVFIKMQVEMQNILSQARSIKLSLDAIDQDNIENKELPGCHANSSVDRIRIFVTNSLRQELKGFMEDFYALQTKMSEDHRDDIRRRLFAITGEIASEEVVEEMIEAGETEKFLRKAIEEQGKGGKIKLEESIHQIQERNASVKKLEESLLALHQIFLDMSVLVDMQDEQLNDIERNMLESVSFIKIGGGGLDGAVLMNKQRRAARNWVIFAFVSLLFVVVGVVVAVITVLVLRR